MTRHLVCYSTELDKALHMLKQTVQTKKRNKTIHAHPDFVLVLCAWSIQCLIQDPYQSVSRDFDRTLTELSTVDVSEQIRGH